MLLEKDISKLSAKKGIFQNFPDLGDIQLSEKLRIASCIRYGQCQPKYKCWNQIYQCNGR